MEEKLKLFLCEDDENLGMLLREYLQAKGYETDLFPDGEAGFRGFVKTKYDLCIIDVMMPKKDGVTLVKEIRTINTEIPVIFLTAKNMKEDILEGFKAGADDYITKPFGMMEFIARVRAVLRRAGKEEKENDVLETGDLQIQVKQHQVLAKGEKVTLTLKEFELLKFLMENKGIVLTRDRLLGHVWGYDFDGETRTVDVHVRTLRQKLGECGELIETVRGVGYRIGG